MHSLVLIVPAAAIAVANTLASELLGGPANFTIPLGHDGTITHMGLRADIDAAELQCLRNDTDRLPAGAIVDVGNDPEADAEDGHGLWGLAHVDYVLAQHGLAKVGL